MLIIASQASTKEEKNWTRRVGDHRSIDRCTLDRRRMKKRNSWAGRVGVRVAGRVGGWVGVGFGVGIGGRGGVWIEDEVALGGGGRGRGWGLGGLGSRGAPAIYACGRQDAISLFHYHTSVVQLTA